MRTNVMQSDNGKEICLTLRHNIIAKISAEDAFRICEKVVDSYFYKGNCSYVRVFLRGPRKEMRSFSKELTRSDATFEKLRFSLRAQRKKT